MLDLKNDKIEKIRKRAIMLGRQIGLTETESEEIAGDVLLRMSQEKHKPYNLKFAVIDAIRSRFGRTGTKRQNVKAYERYSYTYEEARDAGYVIGSERAFGNERADIARLFKMVKRRKKEILKMLMNGFNHIEIAEAFNVSRSRISQEIAIMRKEIKDHKERSEILPIIKNESVRQFCKQLINRGENGAR